MSQSIAMKSFVKNNFKTGFFFMVFIFILIQDFAPSTFARVVYDSELNPRVKRGSDKHPNQYPQPQPDPYDNRTVGVSKTQLFDELEEFAEISQNADDSIVVIGNNIIFNQDTGVEVSIDNSSNNSDSLTNIENYDQKLLSLLIGGDVQYNPNVSDVFSIIFNLSDEDPVNPFQPLVQAVNLTGYGNNGNIINIITNSSTGGDTIDSNLEINVQINTVGIAGDNFNGTDATVEYLNLTAPASGSSAYGGCQSPYCRNSYYNSNSYRQPPANYNYNYLPRGFYPRNGGNFYRGPASNQVKEAQKIS